MFLIFYNSNRIMYLRFQKKKATIILILQIFSLNLNCNEQKVVLEVVVV